MLCSAMLTAACVDEGGHHPPAYETGESGGDVTGVACDPEAPDGQWDPMLADWTDPGEAGDPPKAEPYHDIIPHHPYMTAVHATHLPSGELMLFHGQGEQRLWTIGAAASDMRWLPLPFTVPQTNPDLCSYNPDPEPLANGFSCYADLFCSGHVVLPDGRMFVAGGNVDGSPSGGGLVDTFTFNPVGAHPSVPPFGWTREPDMAVDRWYPTLTVIPAAPGADPIAAAMGRVLISSGASRVEGGQNTFELYDPSTGVMSTLNIEGTSPFTAGNPIPFYPFIFVLPNGDIFYAGGEGAPEAIDDGRVLLPDYNNNGTWRWHEQVFDSDINGGSAVMYAPGRILKSGGVHRGDNNMAGGFIPDEDDIAEFATETIDLSTFASGDYADPENPAPEFTTVARSDMNRTRHFHTLTVLPDGRVIATGGNTRGNGHTGDSQNNACDYNGEPIGDELCSDANLDGMPDPGTAASGCPAVASRCSGSSCPFLALAAQSPCESTACGAACDAGQTCAAGDPEDCCAADENCNEFGFCQQNECHDIDADNTPDSESCGAPCSANADCPPGSTCAAFGHCIMPCPGGGGTCGAVVHCSNQGNATGGKYCDPGRNECFATQTAEIWDPSCDVWTELGEQQRPRMYHSTALLLPDRRVISMGGGHRQGLDEQFNAEYFMPEYGAVGTANVSGHRGHRRDGHAE